MECSAHPNRAVRFEFVATHAQPFVVETIVVSKARRSIPIPFIDTNHSPALYADAAVGEKIGRIGEYHIEPEIEIFEQFDTIALQKREFTVGGFVIGDYLHAI